MILHIKYMLDSFNPSQIPSGSELPRIYFNSIFQTKRSNRLLANSTLPELPRKSKQSLSPSIKGMHFNHKIKNPYKKVVRYSLSDRDRLFEDRSKVSQSHLISIADGVKGMHISTRSGSKVFGRTTEELVTISLGDTIGEPNLDHREKEDKKANTNQLLDLKNLRTILRKTSKSKIKSYDFRNGNMIRSDIEKLGNEVRMNCKVLNSYKGAGPLRIKQA
jgi:hypothetical protein